MKIKDLLEEVDELKTNDIETKYKLRWLSVCEAKVIEDVLKTHEPIYTETFNGYTEDDMNRTLLVPDAYADLYKYYLYAMIDSTREETKRYEGSMQLYNMMLKDFTDFYNRTHMPIQHPMRW